MCAAEMVTVRPYAPPLEVIAGTRSPEVSHRSSRLTFHSFLGGPDIPVLLPNKEKRQPVAVFNASYFSVPENPQDPESPWLQVAMPRVMTEPHVTGIPDKTNYLGVYTFELNDWAGALRRPNLIDIQSEEFVQRNPDIAGLNLEDFRLKYAPQRQKLMGCATAATSDGIPLVALVEADYSINRYGAVELHFSAENQMRLLRDEKGNPIEGKNAFVSINRKGEPIVIYRPEFDGVTAEGQKRVNNNKIRFLRQEGDSWVKAGEDVVLPFAPGVTRYGLNTGEGRVMLDEATGEFALQIHHIVRSPEGKHEYGYRWGVFRENDEGIWTCIGVDSEPMLDYQTGVAAAGIPPSELNPEKLVLYCNGNGWMQVRNSNNELETRWGMLNTWGDNSFGVLTFSDEYIREVAQGVRERLIRPEIAGRRV